MEVLDTTVALALVECNDKNRHPADMTSHEGAHAHKAVYKAWIKGHKIYTSATPRTCTCEHSLNMIE